MARHHRYRTRRNHSRRQAESAPRRNPPLMADLAQWLVPGFAGFGAARFLTHVASTQVAKRKPSWGKHVGAVASIGSFLSAWFLAHRWKAIAQYHTPITVGAGIAAIQSLIQIYFPGLGWMISDASPDLVPSEALTGQELTGHPQLLPVHDDPNEYTYNDSFDPGRASKLPIHQTPPIYQGSTPQASGQQDLSDLALDDAIGQSQNLGVFNGN